MVSLGNTSASGAVFFDAAINMDDEEFQPVLSSTEQLSFGKLDTAIFASIPLILGVIIEIIGIIFISLWPEEQSKCNSYFIFLYLHCGYWFVIMLTDYIIKLRHHNLRICGYLDFYQSTYQHIRTPLFVSSLWNTMYLFLAAILHHTHKLNYEDYCHSSEWFTPVNYILLLTTLELMIIVPVYINYISMIINLFVVTSIVFLLFCLLILLLVWCFDIERVHRFNRMQPPPDVTREEWLSSFTQDSFAGNTEVGYRERDSNLSELLEKQADLIRYLRDHNVKLSHRMMLLASQRHQNT